MPTSPYRPPKAELGSSNAKVNGLKAFAIGVFGALLGYSSLFYMAHCWMLRTLGECVREFTDYAADGTVMTGVLFGGLLGVVFRYLPWLLLWVCGFISGLVLMNYNVNVFSIFSS